MIPRILSYGGGLDSFTMLVEGLRRGDRPDVVTFVDVGDPERLDPGEWPSTYRHIDEIVRPLCEREGLEFVTIASDRYPVRDARSLFAWLYARNQIPVAGPNRVCTAVAKVERFEAWLSDRFPDQYRAKMLPELIKGVYRPKPNPCGVCGAKQKATKATGCTWLT